MQLRSLKLTVCSAISYTAKWAVQSAKLAQSALASFSFCMDNSRTYNAYIKQIGSSFTYFQTTLASYK